MEAIVDKFIEMHVDRILRNLRAGIERFNGLPGWGLDEEGKRLFIGLVLEKALIRHDPEKYVFTQEELLSSLQEAGLVRVADDY